MKIFEVLRAHALSLPLLAKFALILVLVVSVPRLCRRVGIPTVVGLLVCGVAIGPHVLNVFGNHAPIVDFFADLGKLLLMFFAGLETNLVLFRKARSLFIGYSACRAMIGSSFEA